MYSIAFPNMFSLAKTNLVKDKDATRQNLLMTLKSTKKMLLGDPQFGSNLRNYLYHQNDFVLEDLIIDDILTAIQTYMQQIIVNRNDIKLVINKTSITANVTCYYIKDMTLDTFSISLTEGE